MAKTAQLSAQLTLSDGTSQDVTSTASWVSSAPAVATVNTAGLVTAVAVGTCDVTATAQGQSAKAAVTVTNPATAMTVTPATAALDLDGA